VNVRRKQLPIWPEFCSADENSQSSNNSSASPQNPVQMGLLVASIQDKSTQLKTPLEKI
jgi:hypothetical protein